jgi:hypothetical protein
MSSFLEKLERVTERWIHIFDVQMNDTTVRALTGEVFIHDASMHVAGPQEEALPQKTDINTMPLPTHQSHTPEPGLYPPVLKKARFYK